MKMKDYIERIFSLAAALMVLLAFLPVPGVSGQQSAEEGTDGSMVRHKEKLAVFTDRNLYIVGEKILFSVFNLSDNALKEIGWSKVLYLELVSPEHEPVIQEKFRLSKEGAEGYLSLPHSILTGNYYLRAYTRWMRNGTPEDYAYARLTIVNPYHSEVSQRAGGPAAAPSEKLAFPSIQEDDGSIMVNTDKETYRPRSRVRVTYSLKGRAGDSLAGLCLTVVREGAVDSLLVHRTYNSMEGGPGEKIFIPETRGLAVTGKVVQKHDGLSVPNARVQLSVLGDDPDYFGYLTGKDGKFYIPIPDYTGMKDFYISAETAKPVDFEILIDKDFSSDFLDFNDGSFHLTDSEKSLAEEMMMNVQVQQAYMRNIPGAGGVSGGQRDTLSFYGIPMMTLRTDDYVRLPSLEEFIFELVPPVTVSRTGGKKVLKVIGDYSDLSIYSPLVMLDHVAISDLSAILAVSPEKIISLDVINATYIRGNINYGGIISIFSRNHDLAGVDLPGYAYFFGLQTLAVQEKISFPSYENDKGNRRNPDFRNCLMWIPDLPRGEEADDAIFYTADKKGEYQVNIRGVTMDGRLVSGTSRIYVDE